MEAIKAEDIEAFNAMLEACPKIDTSKMLCGNSYDDLDIDAKDVHGECALTLALKSKTPEFSRFLVR